MLDYSKITWLHAEITNLCNAHCPACARNNNGYGIKEGLKLNSVTSSQFAAVLNQLPNLNTPYFVSAKTVRTALTVVS